MTTGRINQVTTEPRPEGGSGRFSQLGSGPRRDRAAVTTLRHKKKALAKPLAPDGLATRTAAAGANADREGSAPVVRSSGTDVKSILPATRGKRCKRPSKTTFFFFSSKGARHATRREFARHEWADGLQPLFAWGASRKIKIRNKNALPEIKGPGRADGQTRRQIKGESD